MARTLIGNFKGPKGDKGDQGAVGPAGPEGKQGPVGPAGGVTSVNGGTGDVVIGGRNLLQIAALRDGDHYKIQFTDINSPHSATKVGFVTTIGTDQQIIKTAELPWLETGVAYTASFTAWTDAGEQNFALDYFPDTLPEQVGFIATTTPRRFTWTVKSDLAEIVNACFRVIIINGVTAKTYFTDFKIEAGTVATDWSPAPEDKADAITGTQGQVAGYNASGKAQAVNIGGTNLLHGATTGFYDNIQQPYPALLTSDKISNEKHGEIIKLPEDKKITAQFWVTTPANATGHYYWINFTWLGSSKEYLSQNTFFKRIDGELPKENHVVLFPEAPPDAAYVIMSARYYNDGKGKIEAGTVATDWSPAPEELVDKSAFEAALKRIEALEARLNGGA